MEYRQATYSGVRIKPSCWRARSPWSRGNRLHRSSLNRITSSWYCCTRPIPSRHYFSTALFGGSRRDCRYVSRRSEEHTSELQSRENLVCRLLLEKKNTTYNTNVRSGRA